MTKITERTADTGPYTVYDTGARGKRLPREDNRSKGIQTLRAHDISSARNTSPRTRMIIPQALELDLLLLLTRTLLFLAVHGRDLLF